MHLSAYHKSREHALQNCFCPKMVLEQRTQSQWHLPNKLIFSRYLGSLLVMLKDQISLQIVHS